MIDVENFLTDLSSALTEMFADASLEKVFSSHDEGFKQMEKQFGKMTKDASLFCQGSELSSCK